MTTIIKIRRDTSSAWTAANPVLAGGELALETDTGKLKLGNGAAAWGALPYEVGRAALQALVDAVGLKYSKPSGGIPATDLATAVVASLAKADAATTPAQVQAKIDALVSGAPGVLDTLDELAAALGDDPNAITTLTAAIAAKYAKPGTGIPLTDLATAAAASLRDRSTHTGTQAMATIIDLVATLAAKYVKPGTGIPEADLASAVVDKLAAVANAISQAQLDSAVAGIVGGAPQTLNTLAELAGALGDDGNLAGTLNGLLALKYTKPTGGIPTTDLSQPVRDALVSVAANTAAITALQATVDQILNPPAAPPTAITLIATAGDGQVVLTRTGGESTTSNGAATATTYALYRGADATGTLLATKLPYTDTGRTNGTAVGYFITATNNAGKVSASATATPNPTPLPTTTFAFRAVDITGVANQGSVATAPAGFGVGPSWAYGDTAAPPTFVTSQGGRPALLCNGGWLKTTSTLTYAQRGFVVARVWFDVAPNSTTDKTIISADEGISGSPKRLWHLAGAKTGLAKTIAWNNGVIRSDTCTGLTGGAWHVVAARWGGGVVETYVDGVSDGAGTGSTGTTGLIGVIIGGGYAQPNIAEVMGGYINEVRGYYAAVTDDEVRRVFADMGVGS